MATEILKAKNINLTEDYSNKKEALKQFEQNMFSNHEELLPEIIQILKTEKTENELEDTSKLLQKKDTITLSNRIDNLASATATGTNLKVNISDTSVMLSKRFERDTVSLSNRINLKVNTLNATIDSSLYTNFMLMMNKFQIHKHYSE